MFLKNPTRFTNFDVNRINIVGVTAVLVILVMTNNSHSEDVMIINSDYE